MNPEPKNALQLFTDRMHDLRTSTLEGRARLTPADALAFARDIERALPPLLEADEARAADDQILSAGRRRLLRTLAAGIEDDALTFQGADTYATVTVEPDIHAAERADLARDVRELDADLKAHLTAHFRRDAETTAVLNAIHAGSGKQDDAQDVLAYAAIARRIPEARRPWTDAELTAAERKATRQLQLLDLVPPGAQEIRTLRNRAWAAFESNYETLRIGGYVLSGGDEATFRRLNHR